MDQLALPTAPRRLYVCTPSRLLSWLDCPRRYRMAYLDRPPPPKGPPWAHTSLGVSVHNALADWWRLPRPQRTPSTAARLVRQRWVDRGFRDATQASTWRERAQEMVSRYVGGLDPSDEPVGVERTVGTRTAALALSGRIDRLDARGDELVVVDYKTGRHLLGTEDARGSLALALYAVAAGRVLRRRCVQVELHHLPTGRVVSWRHSDETLARHLSRAQAVAEEAQRADEAHRDGTPHDPDTVFPPRPGRGCAWCDYLRVCPAGQEVTIPAASWAGLAEDRTPSEPEDVEEVGDVETVEAVEGVGRPC